MKAAPEKAYLRALVKAVEAHIAALDDEMKIGVSTAGRGQRIAALANELEIAKDRAKHFGLALPLKENEKGHRAARIAKRAAHPAADR
jgi:hypothetical protein